MELNLRHQIARDFSNGFAATISEIAATRGKAMRTESDYRSCASRLRALADPDRLKIVKSLLRGAMSVSGLSNELKVGIDKISHHLGVLRAANLVQSLDAEAKQLLNRAASRSSNSTGR